MFRQKSLASLLLTALFSTGIQAQITLEEIVVTAQKREENLQDTPIAITAFTEDDLNGQLVNDISKVADFTPNVVFDTTTPVSGASNGAVVFIRGIGQLDFSLATDPGVGIYIDGVYSSRALGGVLDILEIERLEILRGSQGTLFGRNTIGGAINITTKRPDEELSGVVEATLGEFDRTDFKGSVSVPIRDNLRAKFSFSSKERDGFVDRINVGDELGNEERQSYRAAIQFEPTEDIDIYATFDYSHINEQSAGSVLVGITESAGIPAQGVAPSSTFAYNQFFVPQNPGAQPYDATFLLGGENDRTLATGPTGTELDTYGASLTFSWHLPWFEFKSITAYRDTDGEFFRDPDNSTIRITETSNPNYRHEQFTQEFQLLGSGFDERLQYVLGVYFLEEKGEDDVFVPIFALTPPPPLGPPAPVAFQAFINNFAEVDNSSFALFGQGTYDITDKLSATFGIRYTEDEKEYGFTQFISADEAGTLVLLPLVGATGSGEVSDKFTETNFRGTLEYQFNEDTLFYFSYTDGFKSGGFNIRYVVPRAEPLSFAPETIESFEIGAKWQGFNNRVRLNAAAFISEYDNIQIQLFETGGGPLTQNAGVADILGLEAEVTFVATDNLLLSAGFGYIDAEYDELNLPTTTVAQAINLDTALANTPETTANVSAEYTHTVDWGQLVLRGDYSYTDDVFNDAQNSPFLFQNSYHLFNASLTFTTSDDLWDLMVFGTNLTDERIITSGDSNFGLGFHEANYNRPREFGVTIRRRF